MRQRNRLAGLSLTFFIFFLIQFFLFAGFLFGDDIPSPRGYVNDFANVLDAGTVSKLENFISTTEAETTAEIAVVTLDSLDGWEIEDYAIQLFSSWQIGKKDKDNGVLLLVAIEDRVLRIEVGYGLEGAITDLESGEIIDDIIVPWFKQDDYPSGIYNGVVAIAGHIYEEYGLEVEEQPEGGAPAASTAGSIPYFWICFLPLFFLISLVVFLVALVKRRCPQCRGFFRLSIKEKVLKPATYTESGTRLVERWCRVCGFRDNKQVRIPKRSHTSTWTGGSGGSSSSGGGFGGGSSGGGGASGKW
ncbi:MAG: TPM domain-containing protein [Actinomycetota bacterium]